MKLHLTASSERGKPVTKSGNEYIELVVQDEHRNIVATGHIDLKHGTTPQIVIWHGNNCIVESYKDCGMDKPQPKTAREDKCIECKKDLPEEWTGYCYECNEKI